MLKLKKILKYFSLLLIVFLIVSSIIQTAPKSYAATCPDPPPITTLSAIVSGNAVDISFGQTVGTPVELYIDQIGSAGHFRSVDVSNKSGYPTTLPDGHYTAYLWFGLCLISNTISINTSSSSATYILKQPAINNYDVTFYFSPVPANSTLKVVANGRGSGNNFPLAAGQSSQSWTGIDGSYSAYITDTTGTQISNEISFGLPSTAAPPPGGAECTDFLGCTNIPHFIPGFGDNTLIVDLIHNILPIAIGIGAFVSVIMILISGAQFAMSSGDPESAAKARSRLIFSLIGFALLALAFGITKIIDVYFLKSQLF